MKNLIILSCILLNILACRLMPVYPSATENTPKQTSTLPDPSITRISHPTPTDSSVITPSPTPPLSDQTPQCSDLVVRILPPLEFEKDLFEHHAKGTFLILHIEAINQTNQVIPIFSEDYHLHYFVNGEEFDTIPHAAATNYLYIRRGENFYQDKIPTNIAWHTYLAFDVDPKLANWQLIIKPGSKFQWNNCEYVLNQNGS